MAGRAAATIAIGIVDFAFPLYLSTSTLRIGTSAVFMLIALVWFYVLALILLGRRGGQRAPFEVRRGPAESAGLRHPSLPRSAPPLHQRFRPGGARG